MKSGAGDDPFGDLTHADESADSEDSEEPEESPATTEPTEPTPSDTAESSAAAADTAETAEAASAEEPDPDSDAEAASNAPADADDIPWVLRRRSVKENRPNITQFFLRDETDRAERGFRGDVEEILDTDVYTLDLREAAYVVAMRHPDEVAELLGEWGYDYLD